MKRLLLLFGMISCWTSLLGQSTVTTFPPLLNNNGSSGITFEVESAAPIIITDVKNLFNSGSIAVEVWYRIGGVQHSTGNAPSVTTANGWVQYWTGNVTGNGSTPVSIPNWTNLTISNGQRVGFAILGGLRYQTWTSSSQDVFTDNTLTIYTGQNIGYGGGGTWPNHPRQFLGSVTYIPSAPCTNPPTAGTANADQGIVCVGGEVNLSLTGSTFGLGMGYQWQSSLNGTTWTNMLNDTTPSIKAYPTDTTWYRAILTCGTGMDTSTAVVVNTIGSPMSGTYTVNSVLPSSGTNFNSFSDLATALNCGGVTGPVVVNVVAGFTPYTDQFILEDISGVSATNTITINGNGAILEYLSTDATNRATVILNGTDWVTLDSLNINALGTTTSEYGFGISLTNNADHNTIRRCNVTVADDLSSSNYAGIVISGSLNSATSQGLSGNYNTIENNVVVGGYAGITCVGQSTDSANGNVISNNTIEDFYIYGSYCYYNDHFEIIDNEYSRPNRTVLSTFYGMLVYGATSSHVERNRIHDGFAQDPTLTSTSYCLYVYYLDGTPADPSVVANNLLYNLESDGTTYSVYAGYHNNTYMVNNTFILDDPTHTSTSSYTTRQLYLVGTFTGGSISNNVVYFNRDAGGTAHMIYATGTIDNMDNNSFYSPSSGPAYTFGYYSGGNINDLFSWQTVTGLDENSSFSNPFFTNIANDNYIPRSAILDGGGEDFSPLVTIDIDGVTRGTPPDIGAYEFTGAPCTGLSQVGVTNITSTAGTVVWQPNPATVTIEWGPTGYKQASITGTTINVPAGDTSSVISGLSALNCYDYYITMNCTSPIPGAPPLMGPYTFCTDCASGPLNGTYTIAGTPGPTNFPTLDSAITLLMGCGINGPVVFNMQGGTHNAVLLGPIDGSSAANTVTFNGSAGYGDSIVATSQSAAIDLAGTNHIFFNDLYVENSSGDRVVWLHESADYISFDNCELIGDRTGTGTNSGVVVASASGTTVSGSGTSASHLSVTNCTLAGHYYGLTVYGVNTTVKTTGYTVTNNSFEDIYGYAMRFYYCDSVVCSNNNNDNSTRTPFYGVYCYYSDNMNVEGNALYGMSTYGMYIGYSNYSPNTSAGSNSRFVNNMIESSGTAGMYTYGNYNTSFYHNSVQGSGSYSFFLNGPVGANYDNIDIRNNIFEMAGAGDAFYISTPPANLTLDYNLYNSSGDIAYSNATSYATLAAWQAADTAWNQNSIQALPGFASSSDLHIVGTGPNDVGDNTVGITVDIDGDPRPASGSTVVDVGADEYTPLNNDVAADIIVEPTDQSCGDSNSVVKVVYSNYGLMNTGTVNVTVNITGAVTATLSGSSSGGVVSLGTDTITVSSFNSAAGGTFNIEAILSMTGDQDASNDTVSTSVTIRDILPRYPVARYDTVCTGQYDTLYFPANVGNLSFQWETVNGDTLGTTDTLVIGPMGSNDTTFIMRSVSSSYHVGPVDNTIGAGANYTAMNHYLEFTVTKPTTIKSVDVFAFGAGLVDVVIQDGVTLATLFTHTVPVSAGGKQTLVLNQPLTPGTYRMGGTTTNNAGGLYRNSAGASYPYVSPDGSVSITGNTFSATYYYFFYNWEIGTGGCPRPDGDITIYNGAGALSASFNSTLQPPTANSLVVDFDASGSSGATTYDWNFGDGKTGTGMMTSHSYDTNGVYTVTLVINGPCGTDTLTRTITITGISLEENLLSNSLVVYPNPSDGRVNLKFVTADSEEVIISVSDLSGKEVLRLNKDALNGQFDGAIDISKLADGTYMLKISNSEMTAIRRLIKQ